LTAQGGASVTALAITLAYLVAMVAIGAWSGRRTRTASDFFVAGRAAGLVRVGFGTMAAAFSGFVFVGGPGLTYRIGAASLWIVLPVGFTAALLCLVAGGPLRRLAGVHELFTVPDVLAARYESRAVRAAAAVTILLGSIAYLAAQLLATGRLLEWVLGLRASHGPTGLAVGIAVGLAVVLAYSVAGGMVAGLNTDVVQGAIMLATSVAICLLAVRAVGGIPGMIEAVSSDPRFGAEFLDPFGGAAGGGALALFFLFGIGVLGQPHMVHKFLMLDDARHLRWMPVVVGGSQAICLLTWIGVGLAVPALVAQGRLAPLAVPDDATPAFLARFAPEWVSGLAIAGVLAAIMSTADSLLNLGAAALVRDLPRAFGRPVRNELRAGKIATLALGLGAGVAAWATDDLVALLGTFAFGTFAAGLGPALVLGLHWDRVGARTAVAAITVGTAGSLALEWAGRGWLPAGVPPSAPALAASTLVVLAGGCWKGSDARRRLDPATRSALRL